MKFTECPIQSDLDELARSLDGDGRIGAADLVRAAIERLSQLAEPPTPEVIVTVEESGEHRDAWHVFESHADFKAWLRAAPIDMWMRAQTVRRWTWHRPGDVTSVADSLSPPRDRLAEELAKELAEARVPLPKGGQE